MRREQTGLEVIAVLPSPRCDLCGASYRVHGENKCASLINPEVRRACFHPENEMIDWWVRVLAHPFRDTPLWRMSIGTASKARAIIEAVPAEQERLADEFERLHEGRIVVQLGPYCPTYRRPRALLAFTPVELELLHTELPEHQSRVDALWARVFKHLLDQCCEAVQRELVIQLRANALREPSD